MLSFLGGKFERGGGLIMNQTRLKFSLRHTLYLDDINLHVMQGYAIQLQCNLKILCDYNIVSLSRIGNSYTCTSVHTHKHTVTHTHTHTLSQSTGFIHYTVTATSYQHIHHHHYKQFKVPLTSRV